MQLINRRNQMHRYAETLKSFQAPCTPFWKTRTRYWTLMPVETSLEKGRKSDCRIFFQVDEALLLFFKQATAQGIPIGGPQLMEKGKEIAEGLGLASFSMSQGWLDRWKARHGFAMKVKCGESLSVDKEATEDWKVLTLKPLLEQYNPCDIYNADETGLFHKCLPSRTLAFKGQTCSGGKLSKDRITLLVAANMDGSDKLPLLTKGKFEKPRCMKNIKSLPTSYKFNSKSWMTGKIFEEWVRKLDRSFLLYYLSTTVLHIHRSRILGQSSWSFFHQTPPAYFNPVIRGYSRTWRQSTIREFSDDFLQT